jgi:hypothetical protein
VEEVGGALLGLLAAVAVGSGALVL